MDGGCLRILRPHHENDGSLWCKVCEDFTDGPCVLHTKLSPDQPFLSRAFATLPKELEIDQKPWMIGRGVFTTAPINEPTVFGPLVGELCAIPEGGATFRFALKQADDSLLYYHLNSDEDCNWMKYVRMANDPESANAAAFQQNGKIFFATLKPLTENEELRVWYFAKYAKAIGKFDQGSTNGQLPSNFYTLTNSPEFGIDEEIGEVSDANLPFDHNQNKELGQDEDENATVSIGAKSFPVPSPSICAAPSGLPLSVPFRLRPPSKPRKTATHRSSAESVLLESHMTDSESQDSIKFVVENAVEEEIAGDFYESRIEYRLRKNGKRDLGRSKNGIPDAESEEDFPMGGGGLRETTEEERDEFWIGSKKKRKRDKSETDFNRLKRSSRTGSSTVPPTTKQGRSTTSRPKLPKKNPSNETKNRKSNNFDLDRLQAVLLTNPFQFPNHSPESAAAWKTAFEHFAQANPGVVNQERSSERQIHEMRNRIFRLLRENPVNFQSESRFQSDPQPESNSQSESQSNSQSEAPLTKKENLLRQIHQLCADRPANSKISVRDSKLGETSQSSDVTLDRLRAVLKANPFQFQTHSNESIAAWKAAFEQLLQDGHTISGEINGLRSHIAKLIREYKQSRVDEHSKKSSLTEREILLSQISELKENRPKNLKSLNDVSCDRIRAVLSVNPYQFHRFTPEFSAAWKTATEEFIQAGHPLKEGRSVEIEIRNMRDETGRLLREFSRRSVDEESSTMTTRDELLRQLHEKKMNQNSLAPGIRNAQTKIREKPKNSFYAFSCDQCPAEFRTDELLQIHGVRHGKEPETSSTTCPDCSTEHSTFKELLDHVDKHKRNIYHKKTPNECSKCWRCFSSPEFLARHIRRIHTETGSDRNFECSTCHEKYITLAALKSHVRVHSVRGFFECPVCLLGLPKAREMQIHTETHRVDEQFPCRICAKKYPEFHILRKHLRKEHCNQTWTCDVCHKVFKASNALKKHKLVHSNSYPFVCETCGRRFKRKINFDGHVTRLHNPQRIYKMKNRSENVAKSFANAHVCEFCTRQYASRQRLLIHQRQKHLERMPEELRFAADLQNFARNEIDSENSHFD